VPADYQILITLALMLIGSVTIFAYLVHRETHRRGDGLLLDWARSRRFKNLDRERGVPPPLETWDHRGITLVTGFTGGAITIARVQTSDGERWNCLIRRLETSASMSGMRSVDAPRTLLDLIDLPILPGQASQHRFVALGHEIPPARSLMDRIAPLMPADLSLIRFDRFVLIDFSGRPFDPVELARITQLAEQLVAVV